ncbi:MAG: DEAD/DEAH box helicase [Xanthomonadales bacterium]|nr:DEAD/DEAH box helicase [Xanthomonadales bacterium]
MSKATPTQSGFKQLNLPDFLLSTLQEVGYESPTPIQEQAIPPLLEGRDLLGHAPTGTGKTAAFALPLLANTDVKDSAVQVLVLVPTRELAIQVAEAFQRYAGHIKGFHVLPIYGGQEYAGQIRQLKRGVHVVVGTPGRVMDHMRKGTLKLAGLKALVLDEADEMLRMGFIDDVQWVLEQTPPGRQIALFSATMPAEIQKIARKHLQNPSEISIKTKTASPATIRQRYWLVNGMHKLDALTRILEVEPFDAMLIFVRTRIATTELAEKLQARGFAAEALNGDMAQKDRERKITQLKNGKLDLLVATDVAARGLDVDRISHVLNFDIPHDTEAYIHRIGRTGRAGRTGDAILFVAPREQRMLRAIEQATRQEIAQLELPSTERVNNKRIADFKQSISDTLAVGELDFMQNLLEQYQQEHAIPAITVAAALAKMTLGDAPLLLQPDPPASTRFSREKEPRQQREGKGKQGPKKEGKPKLFGGMQTYRISVGRKDGVKPGNIVGAITNEAGLDGQHIGNISIENTYCLVDLPAGMPDDILNGLKSVKVCGKRMDIALSNEQPRPKARKPSAPSGKPKRRAPTGA